MAESVTRITNLLTVSLWLRLQKNEQCGVSAEEIYEGPWGSRNDSTLTEIKESLAELVIKGYATMQVLQRGTCSNAEVHFPTKVPAYLDISSPEQTEAEENDK